MSSNECVNIYYTHTNYKSTIEHVFNICEIADISLCTIDIKLLRYKLKTTKKNN